MKYGVFNTNNELVAVYNSDIHENIPENAIILDDSVEYLYATTIIYDDVTVISPRQARLKLLEVGLLDDLEAIISTNRAWQIGWEYATEVRRDSPLIDAIATQAGMTSEQIDQLFVEAAAL